MLHHNLLPEFHPKELTKDTTFIIQGGHFYVTLGADDVVPWHLPPSSVIGHVAMSLIEGGVSVQR
jgi:hypothetical protein